MMLKTLGEIFVPLIPGVIAAGICSGVAVLLAQLVPNYAEIPVWNVIYNLLTSELFSNSSQKGDDHQPGDDHGTAGKFGTVGRFLEDKYPQHQSDRQTHLPERLEKTELGGTEHCQQYQQIGKRTQNTRHCRIDGGLG